MKKTGMIDPIVAAPESVTAYGIFFRLLPSLFVELAKSNAEKKVEIAIAFRDTVKEFTLTEFLMLLGFDENKK